MRGAWPRAPRKAERVRHRAFAVHKAHVWPRPPNERRHNAAPGKLVTILGQSSRLPPAEPKPPLVPRIHSHEHIRCRVLKHLHLSKLGRSYRFSRKVGRSRSRFGTLRVRFAFQRSRDDCGGSIPSALPDLAMPAFRIGNAREYLPEGAPPWRYLEKAYQYETLLRKHCQ